MPATIAFPILIIASAPSGGSITLISQAQTFQAISPWGQTVACFTPDEALQDIFFGKGGSRWSGRMGNYFQNGVTNGAVMPLIQQTGTFSTTTGIITGLTSTAGIQVGWPVTGANAPANATVASIQSATQLTMSANGTAATSATVYFVPLTSTFQQIIESANQIETTP